MHGFYWDETTFNRLNGRTLNGLTCKSNEVMAFFEIFSVNKERWSGTKTSLSNRIKTPQPLFFISLCHSKPSLYFYASSRFEYIITEAFFYWLRFSDFIYCFILSDSLQYKGYIFCRMRYNWLWWVITIKMFYFAKEQIVSL